MKIYPQPVYDLDELAHSNLHIHTAFSACGNAEMTAENIIRTAEEVSISMIALTDHYDHFHADEEYLCRLESLKKACAAANPKLKVLFGFELSHYGVGQCLETDETNKSLDYRLVSCNHYDRSWWGKPADQSVRGFAVFTLDLVRSALESRRYDCVAHLLVGRFVTTVADRTEVTRAMTDDELYALCLLAAETETALELNAGAVRSDPALFRRLWNLGRQAGTTFHYGTDAHRLDGVDTAELLPEIKKILL